MADDFLTISDLARINDQNIGDFGASELLNRAPLIAAIAAAEASHGTQHKYLKKTGAPVVGFRAENAGREMDHSVRETVTIDLKVLDASAMMDVAVADIYPGGPEMAMGMEIVEHIASGLFTAEKQLFYGTLTGGAAAGFAGLSDNEELYRYLDSANIVNATGTSAGAASSVWLIRTTGDQRNLSLITGRNQAGNTIDVKDTVTQQVKDGDDKWYTAYVAPILGWIGFQIGTKFSAVRIVNLTAESGKGLTDDLVYEAMAKFPAGLGATHIVMNQQSLFQLRKSRTATNATGVPAPLPTEVNGTPIVVTDSLSTTEAIVANEPND